MKINLGDYELVHSGIVISIKDNPITITLKDEIEGDYTFIINFTKNSESTDSVTKYTPDGQYILKIDFENFDGFTGGGNPELVFLGTLKKCPLFFNFRVFDLANVGKTLMFNFYVGKEAENAN